MVVLPYYILHSHYERHCSIGSHYNPFADTDAADLGIFGSSDDQNNTGTEEQGTSSSTADAGVGVAQVPSADGLQNDESQIQESTWRVSRQLPLAQSTATFSEYFLVDELLGLNFGL